MENMNDLFITATRLQYRFPFHGSITVEDLWTLGFTQLNEVYKTLIKSVKGADEAGLFEEVKPDQHTSNMIEIVKYIFSVKKAEEEEVKKEREKAAKRKRILEIMARKQDEKMESMSEEELRKMLEETV